MKKTLIVASFAVVIALAGIQTAYGFTGYGGGGGGGGGSAVIVNGLWNGTTPLGTGTMPQTVTPVVTSAPVTAGRVLGASSFSFSSDLSFGSTGNSVTELQNRLTAEGVYTGPITGTFGPLTLAGVKAFQTKKGLPTTGYVGTLTRGILNGSTAPVVTSNSGMSTTQISQTLDLFFQLGIITADKLAQAKKALGL